MRCRYYLGILIFCLVPANARARDYYYFSKPGIDRDSYLEDRLECDALAGGGAHADYDHLTYQQLRANNSNLTAAQHAAAVGIASFFFSLFASAENRRLKWQIERICLADKGYKRIEVEKQLIREIEKLEDPQEKIDRLFALASSESPIGKEMHE